MSDISAIASELLRIQNNIDNALNAIKEKGVTVASDATSDDLAAYIMLIKALTYTNLVPTATDTDGNIYNGVGYKNDTRLSSSGGVSSSPSTGSVTVGFLPFKNTDIIRMKGAEWVGMSAAHSGMHFYLNLYDSNKKFIDGGGMASSTYDGNSAAWSQLSVVYDEVTGVTTFQIVDPNGGTGAFRAAAKNASYFRINGYGSGENLIITVNEEI